jgi:hypothetical protein
MSRSLESQLKRARELALKERRQRKQDKKAARAAARLTAADEPAQHDPEMNHNGPAADGRL